MHEPERTSNEVSAQRIAYGIHAVAALVENHPERIERVYFVNRHSSQVFALLKACRKLRMPYQVVPPEKLAYLAGHDKHQGVVAQCTALPFADAEAIVKSLEDAGAPPLLLVPASLEDPRNLGALIRTSAAFGVSAILLERKNSVALNATVAKAAAGMLEQMPVARPRNLEKFVSACKQRGYCVVAAVAGAQQRPDQIDFCKPVILVVGGENRGIPPYLRGLCTHAVGIPMEPVVGSLNVSVAAAVVLYECFRQRAKRELR